MEKGKEPTKMPGRPKRRMEKKAETEQKERKLYGVPRGGPVWYPGKGGGALLSLVQKLGVTHIKKR